MKKAVLLMLLPALCSTPAIARSSAKAANFSGNWVLVLGQTKNLPDGVESYTMAVNQDAQQLKVNTTLEGDLRAEPETNPDDTRRTGGGYPGSRGGGMGLPGRIGMGMPFPGMPGGGGGWPGGGGTRGGGGMPGGGGGSGSPRGERRSQTRVAAFTYYPPKAVYNLDGKESTTQLGGPTHDDATIRADWEKSGKELKLSLLESSNSEPSGSAMQIRDQWKLADNGQSLLVDRTVRTSHGSTTLHLVFRKQQAESTSKTAQSQSE